MTEPLTEKLLSCYKVRGFSSLFDCFTFIFCRVMTFICFIGLDFMFGLLDCVHCKEDFVISRFFNSRFCSVLFTVTLARLKTDHLLYRGLRYIEVR